MALKWLEKYSKMALSRKKGFKSHHWKAHANFFS